MNQQSTDLRNIFSKNRTEELGKDVWAHFVIPPYYDKLDLIQASKPRVIIGGRGCGKTMLLRYLCHHSAFSRHRGEITPEALKHIGLYWRSDTQFCNGMTRRGLAPEVWESAFNHYIALTLGMEIISSIHSIVDSNIHSISAVNAEEIDLTKLKAFDPNIPADIEGAYSYFESALSTFESWVNNVTKLAEPIFLPGKSFVGKLIELIKAHTAFAEASFYVYIDEYENFHPYQKEIINTWLKHSEAPLIFNFAMKRDYYATRKTAGQESIAAPDDYREVDLEDLLLSESQFPLFAAEILLLELSLKGIRKYPKSVSYLREAAYLPERQKEAYKIEILTLVRHLFPELSHHELAKDLFATASIYKKLERNIAARLKELKSPIPIADFLRPELPEASIVISALLHRERSTPDELREQLNLLQAGKPNHFTGERNWIHNNFIGCLLFLYSSTSKACPFYAGFGAFCQLSHGNIRHFLELCNKSINHASRFKGEDAITIDIQAEAARQTSKYFLMGIRSSGPSGEKMYSFVQRLGQLFSLSQARPSQSENELNHFAIIRGREVLTEENDHFLSEAVKWSVLFEVKGTKTKSETTVHSNDYLLNPIYAPYFNISYRKKRRLEISTDHFKSLADGSIDDFVNLMKTYTTKWGIEGSANEVITSLFTFVN